MTIVTFFNWKCLADFFCLSVAQTPILNACTKEEITRMSKEVIGRTTQAGNLKLNNRWTKCIKYLPNDSHNENVDCKELLDTLTEVKRILDSSDYTDI